MISAPFALTQAKLRSRTSVDGTARAARPGRPTSDDADGTRPLICSPTLLSTKDSHRRKGDADATMHPGLGMLAPSAFGECKEYSRDTASVLRSLLMFSQQGSLDSTQRCSRKFGSAMLSTRVAQQAGMRSLSTVCGFRPKSFFTQN
jgi:hypothetical protein